MRSSQERVEQFMRYIGDVVNEKPTLVGQAVAQRRFELIEEELLEYRDANARGDLVAVADALGDLLYTVLGLACLHGIDAQPIFDEVHRSNMTKEPVTDNPLKLCRKGAAFRPPRIAELLIIQSTGVADAV